MCSSKYFQCTNTTPPSPPQQHFQSQRNTVLSLQRSHISSSMTVISSRACCFACCCDLELIINTAVGLVTSHGVMADSEGFKGLCRICLWGLKFSCVLRGSSAVDILFVFFFFFVSCMLEFGFSNLLIYSVLLFVMRWSWGEWIFSVVQERTGTIYCSGLNWSKTWIFSLFIALQMSKLEVCPVVVVVSGMFFLCFLCFSPWVRILVAQERFCFFYLQRKRWWRRPSRTHGLFDSF